MEKKVKESPMKKIKWMLLALMAVLSISFVACDGDDDGFDFF